MKILSKTSADYKSMPWKNGGGITREMAIFPEGATLGAGDFLWRVSSADVSTGGPFSLFPEYDRLLFLLSGGGMLLSGEGRDVRLDHPLAGHSFRGDVPYGCTLLNGPVTDFNVIWRRDVLNCEYRTIGTEGKENLFLEGDVSFLFSPSGNVSVRGEYEHALKRMDLMIFEEYFTGLRLAVEGRDGFLLSVTLTKRQGTEIIH